MGSFNVACSVSHISIDCYDPVVFIPLVPAPYRDKIGDGTHMMISSECFYEPASLPIFGTYADYGSIEVEQDAHTAFLAAREIASPNILATALDVWLPHTADSAIAAGMFVHREIYETVRDDCSAWDEDGGKKDMRAAVAEMYDRHVKNIRAWVPWGVEKVYPTSLTPWSAFNEVYDNSVVEAQTLRDELIDFQTFAAGMYRVNTFFFPAMNGCQFGNSWATYKLFMRALRIEEKRIEEHIKQQEEWESEE